MKSMVFAAIALGIGAAAGVYCTRHELKATDIPQLLRKGADVTDADLSPAEANRVPKVVVANGERYSFGIMDRNQTRSHDFIIRNDGNAPLQIVKGATTCKCTTSELANEELQPGEEATVRLEWTANSADLVFEQSAQFTTNDPLRRVLYLLVTGTVVDVLKATPSHLKLSEVPTSEGASASLKVLGFRDEPLTVDRWEWTDPKAADFIEVLTAPIPRDQLPQEPGVGSGVEITANIKPGAPIGSIDQTLRVWTNLQPETPLEIPVAVQVVGDIRLAGPGTAADRWLVVAPTVDSATGLKHTVFINVKGPHRAETQLKLVGVEPATDFQAKLGDPIRENERVDRYPLTIEIPPGAAPVSRLSAGSYAQIRIETTHPVIQDFTVNVRYVIKK